MRNAKRARLAAGVALTRTAYREPFAAGIALNENPNRGKRHAARMTDAFLVELAQCESRAYTPLSVSHPTVDRIGRRNPRSRTRYTV